MASTGWCASTAAHRESRFALDARLRAANPHFDAHVAAVNPDGDVDLADGDLAGFRMVAVPVCATVTW